MNELNLNLLAGVITSIVAIGCSALVSVWLKTRYFEKKRYSPVNALELLRMNRPEEWNEVRIANPTWIPDLQDVDLSGVAVPSVNFQGANIKGVRFDSANLEGCDFFRASIKLSSFQGASLVGVRFDEALIEESHFEKALLDGASFVGTRIVETNLSTDQGRILPLDRDPLEWTLQDRFSIDLMNPWEFERFVGTLFTITGFQVYGRPEGPDEGFDFVATKDDPIKGKEIYLVECKKYRPDRLVNISPLRALLAKRGEKNADHVVLVSSSGFTDSVRQLASEIPGVDLLDRHALQQLVVKALNRRPENHM